jgi:hypothetical protein
VPAPPAEPPDPDAEPPAPVVAPDDPALEPAAPPAAPDPTVVPAVPAGAPPDPVAPAPPPDGPPPDAAPPAPPLDPPVRPDPPAPVDVGPAVQLELGPATLPSSVPQPTTAETMAATATNASRMLMTRLITILPPSPNGARWITKTPARGSCYEPNPCCTTTSNVNLQCNSPLVVAPSESRGVESLTPTRAKLDAQSREIDDADRKNRREVGTHTRNRKLRESHRAILFDPFAASRR